MRAVRQPHPKLAKEVKAPLPDELIDEPLASAQTGEGIAAQDGLLSQLTKRLVERVTEVGEVYEPCYHSAKAARANGTVCAKASSRRREGAFTTSPSSGRSRIW